MKQNAFFLFALWVSALLGLTLFSACHSEPIVVQLPDDGNNGGNNGGNNNGGNNGGSNANECPEGTISFQYEVLPLLVSSCATSGCHDAASHKEGVIMDSYDNIMEEVKPNKPPSKSKLYQVLVRSGRERMPPPPNPAFTQEQIDLIANWIDQGAPNTDCLPACDPYNYTFNAVIYPTILQSCTGCHSGSQASGSVWLETYDDIYLYAVNGKLLGSIKHEAGYSAMPPGLQLDDCRITQIENWINNGAPND
ncbi:MAG TPA: hypothetical protein ENJ88_08835 [Phaeodactylibacter sp.]|nr:hypothetical protein [Phaeodactylibacter sp.]